jgi:dolichol-phosphate mannosyltransferase
MIRIVFRIKLNDTTNAFKAYRKETLDGLAPFLSPHFNLTVELPLKTIVRGYTWAVIPITWRNRRTGVAKLKLRDMGSRYLFIIFYCWLEKYFRRGDYRKQEHVEPAPAVEEKASDARPVGQGEEPTPSHRYSGERAGERG